MSIANGRLNAHQLRTALVEAEAEESKLLASLATERAARESAERELFETQERLASLTREWNHAFMMLPLIGYPPPGPFLDSKLRRLLADYEARGDRAVAAESTLAAMREAIRRALESGAEDDMICSDCAQFVFRGILSAPPSGAAPQTAHELAIEANLNKLPAARHHTVTQSGRVEVDTDALVKEWLGKDKLPVCAGCNAPPPWNHRCFGDSVCGCAECREPERTFGLRDALDAVPEVK